MARNMTTDDSINDLFMHQIQQAVFTDTEVIKVYDTGDHNSATFIGRITDGTFVEKIVVDLVSKGTSNRAIDIRRIAIDDNYMDLTIQTGTADDFITLIITNTNAVVTNTLRFYVIPCDL